jgi:hypothetical protein
MTLDPILAATLADVVLIVHFAIAYFVGLGLVFIVVGNVAHWRWVNDIYFRFTHLCVSLFVVIEAWFGFACPLTSAEMWLRSRAGSVTYREGFVEHWVQRLLYYDGPSWAYVLGYTAFGALLAWAWFYSPPEAKKSVGKRAPGTAVPKRLADLYDQPY